MHGYNCSWTLSWLTGIIPFYWLVNGSEYWSPTRSLYIYIATYCNSYLNRVNQYMTYVGPLEFLEQTWSVCWNKWILQSGTWAYEMVQVCLVNTDIRSNRWTRRIARDSLVPTYPCMCPSTYLPIYLSTCFNCCTYLSTYLWSIYLPIINPSIYLPI